MGEQFTAREAEKRLEGREEAVRTFERFASHLGENGVDLEKTKIQFGAQLALSAHHEVFVGEGASTANAMLTRQYRKPFVVPAAKDV